MEKRWHGKNEKKPTHELKNTMMMIMSLFVLIEWYKLNLSDEEVKKTELRKFFVVSRARVVMKKVKIEFSKLAHLTTSDMEIQFTFFFDTAKTNLQPSLRRER